MKAQESAPEERRESGVSLIPFLIFIGLYLGIGIYLTNQNVEMAFYVFPILVACLIGIIAAFIMHKGTMGEKMDALIHGMGNDDVITMCLIYILAGAFSTCSAAAGSVDSTVNFALTYISPNFLLAGVFLIAAFLSLAMGTSMGTIGAITPIAVELAVAANLNVYLTLGAVLGGSMFGDNLSIISDTTIAATRSQGVEMRDKFRMNFFMAIIAMVITFILLLALGRPEVPPEAIAREYNFVKILPYLFVLIAALVGVPVFLVLTGGIVFSAIVGIATGTISFLEATSSMGEGMLGMAEIYILSMLVGGLASMCRRDGGFNWLVNRMARNVKSRRGAEGTIAGLVSVCDLAAANNTVAIIISGPLAKDLSNRFKVDPRRTASILDSFSCVFQGIIPYGAQMLLAVQVAQEVTGQALNPMKIIPNCWYNWLLAVVVIISMFVPFTDGPIKKDPWNYEYDCKESEVEAKKKRLAAEAAE